MSESKSLDDAGISTLTISSLGVDVKRFRCSKGHEWNEAASFPVGCAPLTVVDSEGSHDYSAVCFKCLNDTLCRHAEEFTGKVVPG